MLGGDTDSLTPHDIASESMWADKYRDSDRSGIGERYRRTRQWHFVDIELDSPNLDQACHNHPRLPPGILVSHGPADACIVDKIDQFEAELANPETAPEERPSGRNRRFVDSPPEESGFETSVPPSRWGGFEPVNPVRKADVASIPWIRTMVLIPLRPQSCRRAIPIRPRAPRRRDARAEIESGLIFRKGSPRSCREFLLTREALTLM